MGLADTVTTELFAARRKTDLEMQISMILERKLAIQGRCNEISSILSQSIFQSDNNGAISDDVATLGFVSSSSGFVPPPSTMASEPYGMYVYEQELGKLQQVESALDVQLENELDSVKAEEESFKKLATDDAKTEFKVEV